MHFLRLCCACKFISGTWGNKRDIAELYVISSSCIFFSCWLMLIMHLLYLYSIIPLEVSETKNIYILQNCTSFFKDRYIVQIKLTKICCGLHIFHGSAIYRIWKDLFWYYFLSLFLSEILYIFLVTLPHHMTWLKKL